jgi:hypothetical protein
MAAAYRYTLLLARRDRALPVLLVGLAVVALVAAGLGEVAVAEGRQLALAATAAAARLLLGIGLAGVMLFGLRRMLDSGEMALLLSRPLGRFRLLLEVWAAYATLALLALPFVGAALWLVGPPDPLGFVVWLLSLGLELALLAAAALLFGTSLRSPAAALLAVLAFYALSRSLWALLALAAADGGLAGPVLTVLSLLLPRLDMLARGEWLVHGVVLDRHLLLALAQWLAYVPLLLAAAALDFSRREL